MEDVTKLIVLAVLAEAIWETLKMGWQEGKFSKDRLGALVVGLLLAFTINFDILKFVGLNPIFNYVGVVATGVLISRGSNFVHDLVEKLRGE